MNSILTLVFLVLLPALAIIIGCWGVDVIDEDPFGWLLLALGVGYPPGAILVDRNRREKMMISGSSR